MEDTPGRLQPTVCLCCRKAQRPDAIDGFDHMRERPGVSTMPNREQFLIDYLVVMTIQANTVASGFPVCSVEDGEISLAAHGGSLTGELSFEPIIALRRRFQ